MKYIKHIGLSFILIFFSINICLAEGQTGMAEFYMILYGLTFCFYIISIGSFILLIRKFLGKKNSKTIKLIAFGFGVLFSIIFYLIDGFYFLPIFWGD
ncbi:MAG: hypothetical protein H6587_06380 [Flavobacteriales bacterium]|nr:hypothetical protein [Flavobacteriales bacterium]MCB9364174.1 hypothetical protein [Flavobacteriales bacterium]